MKDIFDNYVEHSFGAKEQATCRFKQFEWNYRKYFPENKEASHLLDIGIGRGEMLSCMKNWGYKNFYGIDISPSTVSFCQSLNLPCKLVDDSMDYLNKKTQSFDVITLLDVLEHIPKPSIIPFMKSMRAALKPGGVLIIQVPNLQAPEGYLHRYNDITHEFGLVEHSFSQIILAAGFEKFHFIGFEELVFNGYKERIKKILRPIYWSYIHFIRKINGNLTPKILHPVFSAIIVNEK